MLGEQTISTERRAQSHNLIRDLIATRTEMLVLYSRLAACKPYLSDNRDEDMLDLLEEFCEILVDYTAAAHFRLYRYIDERMEKRQAVLQMAEVVYPRIAETTRMIVDFNDRYDGDGQEPISTENLEEDLSSLGEALAERIELEDRLIEVLSAPRSGSAADRQTMQS